MRPDTSDPLVRDELARLECGYRIGRLLVFRGVWRHAASRQPPRHIAPSTSNGWRSSSPARWDRRPCFSGSGSHNALYASAYTIQGGTSNVMRNIIAERVLGLPKG